MLEPAEQSTAIKLLEAGPPECVLVAYTGDGLEVPDFVPAAFDAAKQLSIEPLSRSQGHQLEEQVFTRDDALRICDRLNWQKARRQIAKDSERLVVLCGTDVELVIDGTRVVQHAPAVVTVARFVELAHDIPDHTPPMVIPLHPKQESETDDLPPAA